MGYSRESTTERKVSPCSWETFSRTAKGMIIIATTIIKLILKGLEWHIVLNTLHILILSIPQPYQMGAVTTLSFQKSFVVLALVYALILCTDNGNCEFMSPPNERHSLRYRLTPNCQCFPYAYYTH